jgi:hypothetical protein
MSSYKYLTYIKYMYYRTSKDIDDDWLIQNKKVVVY